MGTAEAAPPCLFYKAVKRTADPAVFRSLCGDVLWRVGQTNVLHSAPVVGLCGFHACENPAAPFLSVLGYKYSRATDALLAVTLGGKMVSNGITTAATSCTALRVVPVEEWVELVRAPAVLKNTTSDEFHVQNGEPHRDGDAPAIVWASGSQEWYKDGKVHRDEDKPAVISDRGFQGWYKDGKRHRDGDKPACIWEDGSLVWYKEGKIHRDGDKPAVIWQSGRQVWYKDGKRHRDGDKPVIVSADGVEIFGGVAG